VLARFLIRGWLRFLVGSQRATVKFSNEDARVHTLKAKIVESFQIAMPLLPGNSSESRSEQIVSTFPFRSVVVVRDSGRLSDIVVGRLGTGLDSELSDPA
jgi:hypothetical protein